MGCVPMSIGIMVMVCGQVFSMMGIKPVMQTQWTIVSRKVVVMGNDRMQDQQ